MLRKYFLAKLFVPFIKRSVSPQFQALFGNLNFWRNSTGGDLKKNSENLVLSQIVWRKYFLDKLFVPLIKRSVSPQFQAIFGKLNFWRKFNRRGPYKNSENLVLSQIVWRKYFLAKLFFPFIKRSVSPQFYVLLGNLNFWRNSTGADLTKIVKI